ncbi:hypothetical protein ACXWTF_12995 [Thiomicrolovo sp. ZZH C-3]
MAQNQHKDDTMQIDADFTADMADILKGWMQREGYDISALVAQEVLFAYYNIKARIPAAQKRKVFFSDVFSCPQALQAGLELFRRHSEAGDSLKPHLSKFVRWHDKYDNLISDWGVHHFHLGAGLEADGHFIQRTGPLLFGIVRDDAVYAVDVYAHGAWTDDSIIEVVHRNWPQLIAHCKADGVLDTALKGLTPAQRAELRKANLNASITVADGTIYHSPGGGITSAGIGIGTTMSVNRLNRFTRDLQAALPEVVTGVKQELLERGYTDGATLKAELVHGSGKLYFQFPDQAYAVDIKTPFTL